MVRKRVIVSGTVQGVFFRDTCRREALAQGVSGWVRNLPDGDVEALFEGGEGAVAAMVRWARTGPPAAEVCAVEVREETAVPEELRGFEVRPGPRDAG
ncbi:acylphosphatase [Streptomyces sp. NBC_00047]|uniref:acylphosphatase n=1 Tax=Streptomyces sp. NBC_00047 TaxID=2975627 RepID=UPI002255DC2C|nr:acylphosphatase [Streptomyces sp. NBC_00047]MCX5610325.1 acylphosphatase [Streptomyces sp. NBC_00047]